MKRHLTAVVLAALAASCGLAPAAATADTCPNAAIRQEQGAAAQLSCRAYEKVSPAAKNSSDVQPGGLSVSAGSGDAVVYSAFSAFAGAPASSLNRYIARRGAGGWATESLNPALTVSKRITVLEDIFPVFTDDLSRAVLSHFALPSLAPGDTEQFRNLYLRDNTNGSYQTITDRPPLGSGEESNGEVTRFAAASPDLQHVALETNYPISYLPGAPAASSYLWSPQNGLSLVSIEPGGETPFPSSGIGGESPQAVQGAVSDDGSEVFFTVPFSTGNQPEAGAQLYVRKGSGTPAAETVHVSAPEAGITDPNGTQRAYFRVASADGQRVLFSSPQKLTADSTAVSAPGGFGGREDLYLYDLANEQLVDLTTADPAGAGILGFVGAGSDARHAYFLAEGQLAPGAIAGAPNFYLWRQGEGITLIATVDPADVDGLLATYSQGSASITPDGRVIAFGTRAAIDPAFDNVDPQTGVPHQELYLYVAGAAGPRCVSCVGSGPATADATITSQLSGAFIDVIADNPVRRNLSADGGRLFFESGEALIGADTNGRIDVYEYEAASGRLGLVSSGTGATASNFVAASPSGDDVFFTTRQRLTRSDADDLVDVYDARAGGGFAEPPPPSGSCEGEACQATSAAPAAPSLSQVSGPGNVKQRKGNERKQRCAKPRKRKQGAAKSKAGKRRCAKVRNNSRKGR